MGMMDGQVAVVVGGHSGFGEAISRRFAAEGAHVVIAARRTELVAEVAASVGGSGARVDITDDDQVATLVSDTIAAYGHLDVFVNCAGFEQSTPIRSLTPDKLRSMQDVQLHGALYCMRHACNAMADSGRGGAFLSLSSLTAHNPAIGMTAYASAKAGLEYATKIAAVEYGPSGVRVNTVAASLIETPMTERIFKGAPVAIAAMVEVTPLRRVGTPDNIADAALFMCGPMGAYVTGQTLCVDGGASLQMLPSPQMFADVAARYANQAAAG